ncbi:EF-hand calcium-binding domain-containing protein 12-like [Ptychodera flava]|uniref:EF-hand calcium-binding domain-containing protein 12-like n=1 Tax=Ptychodera flava TaxID=63121 RepID=UPI003969C4A3
MMTDDAWADFGLQRLFNPNNIDFLPLEEQIKLYKQRDLAKTKAIRTEWKIWGEPRNRKRIIIAPPMEKITPPIRRYDVTTERFSQVDRTPSRNTETPPHKMKTQYSKTYPPMGEKQKRELEQQKMDQRREVYSPWLKDRRGFRKSFEQLDDCSFQWVSRKPSKSPIERKYYRKQLATRSERSDDDAEVSEVKFVDIYDTDVPIPPEDILSEISFDSSLYDRSTPELPSRPNTVSFKKPKIIQPSAKAMALIADYIQRQRIRMIELFMRADKNKDWKVNKTQFRQCMAEARIQLSDNEVEELMMTLDTDENGELDYRKFVYGLRRYKQEQNDLKSTSDVEESDSAWYSRECSSDNFRVGSSRGLSRESSALLPSMGESSRGSSRAQVYNETSRIQQSRESSRVHSATEQRQGSAPSHKSRNATTTPVIGGEEFEEAVDLLEVPPIDISEQIEMNPDDLIIKRKREKVFNKLSGKSLNRKKAVKSAEPKRIYTGESKLDNFSTFSSLAGDMSGVANKYKEDHVKEFRQVLIRCKQRNVPIDERMLENGLLFPNDRPLSEVTKKIRQPGLLFSKKCGVHFARHCRHLTSMQQKSAKKKH